MTDFLVTIDPDNKKPISTDKKESSDKIENAEETPKTGDSASVILWTSSFMAAGVFLIMMFKRRRNLQK